MLCREHGSLDSLPNVSITHSESHRHREIQLRWPTELSRSLFSQAKQSAERCPAHAQLYKEAGVPGRTFTGVPVFQAQGLTVKTENSRYTPLFLAKEDLDVAVGAAFSQREAAKEVANKSKASAAEEEVASAQAAVRATRCRCCHAINE